MTEAPDSSYDLILLDAFSSDAVPTHLLTREAFELYLSRLAPDGVLVVNISNRHLDLEPLLAAHAAALGLTLLARTDDVHRPPMRVASTWAVLALRPERLRGVSRSRWYAPQPEPGFRAWSDDYTSLLPLVRALR